MERPTRPVLYLIPPLFSSFPARVMLEALPGGVPNRSASRMPVELRRDPGQVSRAAAAGGVCQLLPRRDTDTHSLQEQ